MAVTIFRGRRKNSTAGELLRLAESGQGRKEMATSYVTNGSVPTDEKTTSELGSSTGGLIPEQIPQFTSTYTAIKTYEQMARDDAAVDVSLRALKMPIMGANFFIEAASGSEQDELVGEFVGDNLLNSMAAPFLLSLEDILRLYEHGKSLLEKVYENREWAPDKAGANKKIYTCLKKLAPRPTLTIQKIDYDDVGDPTGVWQSAVRANGTQEKVFIPIDKLVVFVNNRRGGSLDGQSILRTAYKHWFYKNTLYTIDGIQKERHGMGFPILTLPLNYTDKDIQVAMKLVKNIRTNEDAGAVLPQGFVLMFAEMKSQPVDVLKSVDHHNGMIMLNAMVQFLLSGVSNTTSGGRATSASAQDMFTKSLRYVANMICEMINFYVIPQLVNYNFKVTQYPKLRVRNIGETKDLQQWASAFASLLSKNAITMDYETEQWARMIFDAPLKKGGKQTPDANATASKMGFPNVDNATGLTPAGTDPPQKQ